MLREYLPILVFFGQSPIGLGLVLILFCRDHCGAKSRPRKGQRYDAGFNAFWTIARMKFECALLSGVGSCFISSIWKSRSCLSNGRWPSGCQQMVGFWSMNAFFGRADPVGFAYEWKKKEPLEWQ